MGVQLLGREGCKGRVGGAARRVIVVACVGGLGLVLCPAWALPGDVNGDGAVSIEDARTIASHLIDSGAALPNPDDADATQDGRIDIDDAFTIAKRVRGESRIVVARRMEGGTADLRAGGVVRIEVFEHFFPYRITGGMVRVRSDATGYDSGNQPLTFEHNGRCLYYHWSTVGARPADDYAISVTLTDSSGKSLRTVSGAVDLVVSLGPSEWSLDQLAQRVDAWIPSPGQDLAIIRAYPNDHTSYPYLGPFGYGWVHNFGMTITEHTDGTIVYHGPDGLNRVFTSNPDGTYEPAPSDHGALTRDPDGTFQLREKDGGIVRFASDLRLDYVQDLAGNRLTAVYDISGRLVEVRHSDGDAIQLAYNDENRIVRSVDSRGGTTEYAYNEAGDLLSSVTDASGATERYTYATGVSPSVDNRLISMQMADGSFVHFLYDDGARLVRTTGTWGAEALDIEYLDSGVVRMTDATGAQSAVQVDDLGRPVVATDAMSQERRFAYSANGDLMTVEDELGRVLDLDYDDVGNLTRVTDATGATTRFGYDLRFNKVAWKADPLGATTEYAYDACGNLQSVTQPNGTSDSYEHDPSGNTTAHRDAEGNVTEYAHNARGQLTAIRTALGHDTVFAYDVAGNLVRIEDANGHAVAHEYDVLGRLTLRTYADGGRESYQYDPVGRLAAFTNRRGETVRYLYDFAGRPMSKEYASGKRVGFEYDARGLTTAVQITTADGQAVRRCAYSYDPLARQTGVTYTDETAAVAYSLTYAYDPAGRRSAMYYPDGYRIDFAYDGADRLTQISDDTGAVLVAYQYDAAGRRVLRTLGNGTSTSYEYDEAGQLTRVGNTSPSGETQSSYAYSYSAAGVRTAMLTDQGIHTYTHDDAYQLTGVVYPDGEAVVYSYDEVGNRRSVSVDGKTTGYLANSMDQYTGVGAEALTYDDNGNLASRGSGGSEKLLTWDEDDRLASVERGDKKVAFGYDHQGRLVTRTVGGKRTHLVWDGAEIVAELDDAGQMLRRFVCGAYTNEVLLVADGDSVVWCQQDGLGSVVAATDDSGDIAFQCEYDVYGAIRKGDLGTIPQRFAGMWWDEDAGLYYARARWYDAALGRFTSPDLLGSLNATQNAYTYGRNSPGDTVDPSGWYPVTGPYLPRTECITDSDVVRAIDLVLKGKDLKEAWSALVGGSTWQKTWMAVKLTGGIATRAHPVAGAVWSAATDLVDLGWAAWAALDAIAAQRQAERGLLAAIQQQRAIMRAVGQGLVRDRGGSWVYLRAAGGWVQTGGMCPTFLQGGQRPDLTGVGPDQPLVAKLLTPWSDSLVRADVPIFGLACGSDFVSYRVEYGEGASPSAWVLIAQSQEARDHCPEVDDTSWMQGDVDLRGNLATWNTGLRNWSHLPWHSEEDPTDLNGVYTVRLVVEGTDGGIAEDRVTCEVGRVIAQCRPGIATSPDGRVVLRFPEQSLLSPFRVYTILPLSDGEEAKPSTPENCALVGRAYRVRDPGDQFTKPVTLEFTPDPAELAPFPVDQLGIAEYSTASAKWVWLATARDGDGARFAASLTALPEGRAIYALLADPSAIRSTIAPEASGVPAPVVPARPGVLVEQTFETDLGSFTPRDRVVGAELSRDKSATPDGTYCLKAVNANYGGNFSLTVCDRPFDVREYTTMSFDYCVEPGVKLDFLLKAGDRWYNLGFTDGPTEYANKDVNIRNLGRITGIVTDGAWHTATVDLRFLLKEATGQTLVQEIAMADWDVGGYMKLEFGSNPRGATLLLDNFRIVGPGRMPETPATVWIDGFDSARSTNALGGAFGCYCNPGTRYCEASLVDVPPASPSIGDGGERRALQLTFDMSQPDAYGGFWTSVAGQDLSELGVVRFDVRADGAVPALEAGLRSLAGVEGRASVARYLSRPNEQGWRSVCIPLRALLGLDGLSSPDVVFLAIGQRLGSGAGTVWLDNLRCEASPFGRVLDFETQADTTLLGGAVSTHEHGAAAISSSCMPDPAGEAALTGSVCRISYGGTIGRSFGSAGGFSYCLWRCGLHGLDARPFSKLALRIRGECGGEAPNFYLSDGSKRVCLRSRDLPALTAAWQTLELPLDHFQQRGVDLSRLDGVEIAFEWSEQSGTIYVDDIEFTPR